MAMAMAAPCSSCYGLRASHTPLSTRSHLPLRSSFLGSTTSSSFRVASLSARKHLGGRRGGGRNGGIVQARWGGGFIPAEHKWMYEGIESLGPDIWNKTWYPKAEDHRNVDKQWYIVDATDKRLGRLASTIAYYIRGKNLPTYTPSVDMGGYVVVVNAEKVGVTGRKRSQKLYRRHSGRPGGLKEETFDQLQKRIPERIVEHAVRGMLPKGRLGRRLFTHLKVFKGPDHPHAAQQPIPLPIMDKRINLVK